MFTGLGVRQLEVHASIDNGNVVISPVGLLELLDVLKFGGEGHQDPDQDLMGLHVYLTVGKEEFPGIDLQI